MSIIDCIRYNKAFVICGVLFNSLPQRIRNEELININVVYIIVFAFVVVSFVVPSQLLHALKFKNVLIRAYK